MSGLTFKSVGSGPRHILALPGWFGCGEAWAPLWPALDGTAATWVFADIPGYGDARDMPGQFSFDEVAQHVLDLADSLGWTRFSLVGHSMGGMAMQKVMLAAPERIERMVGVAPVPACGSRLEGERLALFSRAVDDISQREFVIDFSTGRRLPAAWVTHMARQSWERSRPEAFASYLREWGQTDFSAEVAAAMQERAVPVRLILGEHDPSLTPQLMERTWMQWYREASMQVLPNAGHYPMDETPPALAAALHAFLLD